MQGISIKILKNHIFFSHYLALRRKCGKRVGILWRNREFATGTCRARASPTFAKEKSKQPWRWRVLRKMLWQQSDIANVVRQHGIMSKHQEMEINASTDNERSEKWGMRDRAPRADTPKGSRPDLHVEEAATADPKTMWWNGCYPRYDGEVRRGNKWVVTLCSIYIEARNAHSTKRHTIKKTGHRLTTQTCRVIYV